MESFGDLDAIVDLPAALSGSARATGASVDDLPTVPIGGRSLAPSLKQKDASAEEMDLPGKPPPARTAAVGSSPKRPLNPGSPTVNEDWSDLPAPVAPTLDGFGELDLPAPASVDLPQTANSRKERRSPNQPPRKQSFGELDLPLAASPELPARIPAAKPPVAAPASPPPPPVAARAAPPLPVAARAAPPPPVAASAPSSPPIAARAAPPPPVAARAAPPPPIALETSRTLDQASSAAPKASASADALDFSIALDAPSPAPASPPEKKIDSAMTVGAPLAGSALLELSDTPDARSAPETPNALIASSASGAPRQSRAPAPDPFALEGSGSAGARGAIDLAPENPIDLARAAAARESAKARREEDLSGSKPPSKRSILKGAAIASVIILAGSSLTFFPEVGAFGWNFIGDHINATAHAASLNELRNQAHADLDVDTSASAAAALQRGKAAQLLVPRHRPTAAYCAFLAFARTYRFGRKGGDDAFGKQLIGLASTVPGDMLDLATAAQDLVNGELERARQTVGSLLQRTPDDVDAAVVAAEIELAAKDKAAALAAWKRAAEIRKGARTLFGLARAQISTSDLAGAEQSARAALLASPKHVGAHTLLASILWQSAAGEEEALTLLGKVTGEGEMRSSASEGEMVEAQTLLGTIHLARSRMSTAEQAFAAALTIDPQAMKALVGSGELFYRSGRYSEALARFEAATRASPTSIEGQIGAAKTYLSLERMKEAKDLLRKVRAANPKSALVAYWQGRTEEALGSKKDAETAYLAAISSGGASPESVDAYVALTYLLSSLGRNDEAAAKLAEAAAKFPDLPALHRAKGEVALQTGRYEEAKSELEAALAREEDLGTRFKLGVALRRMRAFDEAALVFDKVAAADKDFPGVALERGLLFEETGQSDKALEMYATALRKAPDDLDLKLRVGSTQVMAGQAKQGEPILKEVLKARPGSAEANHFLGRALLMKGTNASEAMRFLERAVEIDPNRAEYHLYVAWAANETGQPGRAESALKKTLELDRDLGDAYWQRGVLLQKQGATLDALNDLQTALQKRPSRYEAYATMALCYQDQSRWPEAEEAWRKAISANDTIPEWHYRLGKIYGSRGNRPGALASLEKAVSLATGPDRPRPAWLFDAHFLLAEALRSTGQASKAIEQYRAYLASAPTDNAYRLDAERALQSLGAPITR